MTHTATPWTVAAGSETLIIGDRIPCIAETHNNDAVENAHFIVRACNAHDDLVAAVKAFLDYDEDDGEDGIQMMVDYADALKKAKAAFEKATA